LALPNASFIGFTGTPIEKTDANTRTVFGDYISCSPPVAPFGHVASRLSIPEAATGDRFEGDEYRFLIVASKFQTGFDQPKLVAMVVDKKLSGVACVQTLSRLNRTTAGKEETFVLDFENTAEDIEKGFQPFYDRVTLSKETDANQLYNIRTDLEKFAIHEAADLEAFANEWFSAKQSVEKLQGVVNPVAKKWQAEAKDDQVDYKSKARDFVKLYSFLIEDLNTRSGACHGL